MATRRELVMLGGGLVAGAVGAAAAGWWRHRPEPKPGSMGSMMMDSTAAPRLGGRYGHGAQPPAELGPLSLDGITRVPPPDPRPGPITRTFSLEVIDQRVGVALDRSFDAWTFGGSVPGPVLRANEGDELVITLRNRTGHAHNLHFHGRHRIEADGWEPVPPGGEAEYRFTAGPFGLHPYHCDFTPTEDHIANGLYGLLIVDPPKLRASADEVALVLGGFDVDGDGASDLFAWNGVAGFYAKYPIKVEAGRLVRVYLANVVTDVALASFHLHAETFEVYRNGTGLVPDERTDILSLGPAERAIVEFRLPSRGRYMFHPHQRQMAEHGAMGWFAAV